MTGQRLSPDFPNFIVVGASKCGTSSLYAYLRQHPEIFLPRVKETHFFTYDEIHSLGPEGFAADYYPGARGHAARGDITPTYFVQPDVVIPRIKAVYGDAPPKFVLIMRNPVDRAWSHYLHKVRSGEEKETFEQALCLEAERMRTAPVGWWGYLAESSYATYLAKWLEAFPREQFLFLLTEDLASNPDAVLEHIFAFLGVDPAYRIQDHRRKNMGGAVKSGFALSVLSKPSVIKVLVKKLLPLRYQQKLKTRLIELNTSKAGGAAEMSEDQKAWLRSRLGPSVRELERLTGIDLSLWSL